MEVGERGRIAVVADSTGVPFAIWESGTRHGAQMVGVPNTWAMSALHTTDLGEAERADVVDRLAELLVGEVVHPDPL